MLEVEGREASACADGRVEHPQQLRQTGVTRRVVLLAGEGARKQGQQRLDRALAQPGQVVLVGRPAGLFNAKPLVDAVGPKYSRGCCPDREKESQHASSMSCVLLPFMGIAPTQRLARRTSSMQSTRK